MRSAKIFLWISLPLFLLDQITKWAILKTFPEGPTWGGKEIEVIPGFFNLVRVHNTGMAFGRFNNVAYANFVFLGIAAIALIVIIVLWRRGFFPLKSSQFAVALLVAGIFGNALDRLLHGYVVDFLDFYIGNWHWPSFNVADSCICVAAALLFWASFKTSASEEEKSG